MQAIHYKLPDASRRLPRVNQVQWQIGVSGWQIEVSGSPRIIGRFMYICKHARAPSGIYIQYVPSGTTKTLALLCSRDPTPRSTSIFSQSELRSVTMSALLLSFNQC